MELIDVAPYDPSGGQPNPIRAVTGIQMGGTITYDTYYGDVILMLDGYM
jgi:hypothetical protein